mgnify:CR=1 FL=1
MPRPSTPTAPSESARIPPLPGGVVQHREGVQRCALCGGEVVVGRTVDGALVDLTPVCGERHGCTAKGA